MPAGIYNITIEQGATFDRLITITEPDGNLKNLVGYSARMHVRRDKDASAVLLELTDANGRIELGGTLGTVRLLVTATDTATLERGGVYDLELIDGSGVVERLLQGLVRLDKEVTR